MIAKLLIPEEMYDRASRHLLPRQAKTEHAGFIFADSTDNGQNFILRAKEWLPLHSQAFRVQSAGYLELTDETRASIIKKAHDTDSSIVEFHSHPLSSKASFSSSDISGLEEFVPHVMWRLKNRPYAAVVVSRFNFDSLFWATHDKPELLSELKVDGRILHPTGLTFAYLEESRNDK